MSARWDDSLFPAVPEQRAPGDRPDHGLDPYVRWSSYTRWRGFATAVGWNRDQPDPPKVPILAKAANKRALARLLASPQLSAAVDDIYKQNLPGKGHPSLHFTAQLDPKHLDWLTENTHILRWKLAMPLRDAQSATEASPKGRFGPDRDMASMHTGAFPRIDFDGAVLTSEPKQGARVGAIAVIDFGCPFLNARFALGKGTRVRALWDQASKPTDPRPAAAKRMQSTWPWQKPAHFMQGRELSQIAMNKMCAAVRQTSGGWEETQIYRGIDYLIAYADARRRVWYASHGGMVLDLAGGATDPMLSADGWAPDDASKAELIFVELPTLTAADSAGGSLAACVLDGIRYAMSRADENERLVVVVSYGNSAGPHNGTALFETAVAELLEARGKNFAVVLAAGNARDDNGHSARTVGPDRSALLRLMVVSDDTTDTFVETWYDSALGALEMRVRSPTRVWSPWIPQGQEVLMRDDTGCAEVVAMIRHDEVVPNGEGALALLALGPTSPPPGVNCALAEPGLWEIEFRLADKRPAANPVDINAWVERDDPVRGRESSRTRFIDQDEDDVRNTLSAMATGKLTYKAAGFNLQSGLATGYSSLPKAAVKDTRLVQVACEEDLIQPTVQATATRTGEVFRMNGTSVAAPVLARRLFNEMVVAPKSKAKDKVESKVAPTDPLRKALRKAGRQGLVRPIEKD